MPLAISLCSLALLVAPTLAQSSEPPRPEEQVAPPSHFAALDTHKIHYVDSAPDSDANAIVLIHGWASDWTFLEDQFHGLKGTARVIAIDLPGHGKSDAPKIDYTMDLFAGAIAAVLDAANVEKAVLVGHSNGVPTIRQFYRNYPQRTLALICLDGALFNVFPAAMAEPVMQALSGQDYKTFIDTMLNGMMAMSSLDDDAKVHIREVMMNTPQHVLVGGLMAGMDPKIWTEDTIDVPTLIINAPNPMWSSDYNEKLQSLGPDIKVQNWHGVSHMLMMEEPEKLRGEIEALLDRHALVR